MHRGWNIFHNLATNENSTTELLCNLSQFAAFRIPFLSLFVDRASAETALYEDCQTQVDVGRHFGRPDLLIHAEGFCALIEVKLSQRLIPTDNQPSGYFRYLLTQNSGTRVLGFLVPQGWVHEEKVKAEIDRLKTTDPTPPISVQFVYWEQVIEMIEDLDLAKLNPFVEHFRLLLNGHFGPLDVNFEPNEVLMLYNPEFPVALSKLEQLVEQIRGRASVFTADARRSTRLCPEEFGMYFRNKNGHDILWFGIWTPFWRKTGVPLCYGVAESWNPTIVEAFREQCSGRISEFDRYLVVPVPRDTLLDTKPVDRLWTELEPLLTSLNGIST